MKYLVSILFIIGFTLESGAQASTKGMLQLENNDYDFGEIMQNQGELTHTFIVKNTGASPFVISNVRSTCECTNPEWTQSPVMPGKEGKITVHFNPKDYVGAFHKTLQIKSTAENSNMFLTFHGVVQIPNEDNKMEYRIADLSLQSKHLNLGYVYKGQLIEKSMLIKNTGTKPLEIDLEDVPEYIDAFVKPSILKPGEYGRIDIYLHSDKTDEWDVIMKKLNVVIDRKKDKNTVLAVTANIREDFSKLTPEELANAPVAHFTDSAFNFNTIKDKKPVNCKFLLRNNGKSDLIIRAVIPSCGCTVAKPDKQVLSPGESTYIQAVFDPEGWKGDFNKVITVITNDPDNYKKYLWIRGSVE